MMSMSILRPKLCEYELQRLQRIEENNSVRNKIFGENFMVSLLVHILWVYIEFLYECQRRNWLNTLNFVTTGSH